MSLQVILFLNLRTKFVMLIHYYQYLEKSAMNKRPVRVIRGANRRYTLAPSPYAPVTGYAMTQIVVHSIYINYFSSDTAMMDYT